MLEELLGRASWPLAFIVGVTVVCLTVYSINDSNHKDDVRKACVAQGKNLSEHNGWPVCTGPR